MTRPGLVRLQITLLGFLFLAALSEVWAEAPTVEALYPAGAARGSSNLITLSGKFSPWPPKVWVNRPGLEFTAWTNSGKFAVRIAPDAEPGPRLVRFYNADGASDPRLFVVGDGREISEIETNNHFAAAQLISLLPVTLNGRLDKRDDVDSFAISMRAGQWLDARIDCYTLMGKADLVLRLVTTNGWQLAWNHDFSTLDPRLIWQAPKDLTVVLQTFGFAYPADSDIRLTGGDGAVYRLHVRLTKESPTRRWEVAGSMPEPSATPQSLSVPSVVTGCLRRGDEETRYALAATKGEYLELIVAAASLGSPLDAALRLETAEGKVLERSDDSEGTADPRFVWKVPSNGTYTVVLGSVTHRGGADYGYELAVRKQSPDFQVSLAETALSLKAGATNEFKLNFKRLRGLTNDLRVSVRGLPEGVTALTTNLGAKDGAVAIRMRAEPGARPHQGAIQCVVQDPAGSERIAAFELTSRTENNGVPGGYTTLLAERLEHLWLTVKTNSPAK